MLSTSNRLLLATTLIPKIDFRFDSVYLMSSPILKSNMAYSVGRIQFLPISWQLELTIIIMMMMIIIIIIITIIIIIIIIICWWAYNKTSLYLSCHCVKALNKSRFCGCQVWDMSHFLLSLCDATFRTCFCSLLESLKREGCFLVTKASVKNGNIFAHLHSLWKGDSH